MKKRFIIILLIVLGIIFFIPFILINKKEAYFSLIGNSYIELDLNDEYKDVGVNAKYCDKYFKIFCKDISNYVKTSKRDVEENRYFINYILKYKNINKVLTREVVHIDMESPVIELSQDEIIQCPNSDHIEDNYSAYDLVDGDLTDKVLRTINGNKVYYSVSDSSGNKKTIFRNITYKDDEAPTISLSGGKTSYVFINHEYVDAGYDVQDNCDNNLIDSVEIKNNVNTNMAGEYEVEYTVSDSSKNKTSVKRKVIVYEDVSEVPKNGKIVYLTFDDGPASYTEKILDILDEYGVKVTFFVTNQFSNYQNLIKREYDSGHTVAVHTFSHNYKKIYSSLDNYMSDFYSINEIIYNQTGQYSKIFRFPGGSSNTISKFNKGIMTELSNKMIELGYYYFDWNVDSRDTSSKDPNIIFQNVKKGIEKEDVSVVLMHDIKKANIESVEKIIRYGLDNGYTFLPLDESSPEIRHKVIN